MSNQPDLRTKIGQLFSVGIPDTQLSADTQHILQQHHIGGVILFHRNIQSFEQVLALNTALIQSSPDAHPLLLSVDQEGGRVARLRDICSNLPPMMRLAQVLDPDGLFRAGALLGRELAALGFHMNHAPVLDVNSNPDNPVIGDRAFGTKPEAVIRTAIPFGRGLQSSGIAAVGKHFPGHGDTAVDSHVDLPQLNLSRDRLWQVEWPPFQAAIEHDFAAFMTAHVNMGEHSEHLPATFSKYALRNTLRNELGFEGLIISDDLDMKAIANSYSVQEAALKAIQAGCDHVLVCHSLKDIPDTIAYLMSAISQNQLSEERVNDAYRRVMKLKRRYIGKQAVPDSNYARSIVNCEAHQAFLELINQENPQINEARAPLLEYT